jgi:SAM-dependent methyltransferase
MIQSSMQTPIERLCPVCGSSSRIHFANERIDLSKVSDYTYASRKQPEFMCLRLMRCSDCDLVYAPTPPASDALFTAYSEAAFDSGPEAEAAARSYAKALEPYVDRLAIRSAAVDVGAGSGPLLPWLCQKGFTSVIGIEPSRAAIDAAPLTVKPMLREGMFSPVMLADVKPSLVCSFMTLEHLSDPGEFVKSAYDLLEPGGMLAVVVHNWRAPLNRLLGLRSPIIDVEHLQLFSPQSVETLFERTGFASFDIQSLSNAYPLRYWLRLTPFPLGIKTRIAVAMEYMGLSDKHVSLRVGNLLAIGIKGL